MSGRAPQRLRVVENTSKHMQKLDNGGENSQKSVKGLKKIVIIVGCR